MNDDYKNLLATDYVRIGRCGNLALYLGKGVCSDCIDITYTGYVNDKDYLIGIAQMLKMCLPHLKDGVYCISTVNENNGELSASGFIEIVNSRVKRLYDLYGSHKKCMMIQSIYKFI